MSISESVKVIPDTDLSKEEFKPSSETREVKDTESKIEFLELDMNALLRYYVSGMSTKDNEELKLLEWYSNPNGKIVLKMFVHAKK